jgi:hypothetical protein
MLNASQPELSIAREGRPNQKAKYGSLVLFYGNI